MTDAWLKDNCQYCVWASDLQPLTFKLPDVIIRVSEACPTHGSKKNTNNEEKS